MIQTWDDLTITNMMSLENELNSKCLKELCCAYRTSMIKFVCGDGFSFVITMYMKPVVW